MPPHRRARGRHRPAGDAARRAWTRSATSSCSRRCGRSSPRPGGGPGGAPRRAAQPPPRSRPTRRRRVGRRAARQRVRGARPPHPRPRARHAAAPRVLAALTGVAGLLQLLAAARRAHPRTGSTSGSASRPVWLPVAGHVVSVVVGLLLLVLADQLAGANSRPGASRSCCSRSARSPTCSRGPTRSRRCSRRHAGGARLVPGRLPRACGPAFAAAAVRFVPIYLVGVLVFGVVTLWTERAHVEPGADPQRGPRDGLRRAGRHRRALHLPSAVLRGVLPGRAGRARRRRAWSARRAALPPARRPARAHRAPTGRTPTRLVHTYGWDTLAYFALRGDKSFFFSPDGEAMIAYTYIGGYALVAGDPIGPPRVGRRRPRRVPRDAARSGPGARAARRPRGEHAALLARVASRPSTSATRRSSTAAGSPSTGRHEEPARRRAPGRTDLHASG